MAGKTRYSDLDASAFDEDVMKEGKLVLVEFGADWYGGCAIMEPVVDALSDKYSDMVRVVRLDVERNRDLVRRYAVQTKPTYLLIRHGRVVENIRGTMSREKLESVLVTQMVDDGPAS